MRGQEAVTIVCELVASLGTGIPVYKNKRPGDFPGKEYIIANSLNMPQESGLQEGDLNINIHVKDIRRDEPDSRRIDEIAELVASLFKEKTDAEANLFVRRSGAEFSLYEDRFFADTDGTHYQNFRIKVRYNN